MTFEEIREYTQGRWITNSADREITTLVLDTRLARNYDMGAVFIAISGEIHDGHKYIMEAYSRGIRNFLVETEADVPGGDAAVIRVTSSVAALQAIGRVNRELHTATEIIGITGSNGKTIVKEWLATMLAPFTRIVRNPGSYNSQVGVPLSLWQIRNGHETGIFEAGISQKGEMERLEQMIQPDYGIFTNIGPAHNSGFASLEEKVAEKMKLFARCRLLVYCRDYEQVHAAVQVPAFSWGRNSSSDLVILEEEKTTGGIRFLLKHGHENFSVSLPFDDPASIENAMHVVAFMVMRSFDIRSIQDGLQLLRPMSMRLERKRGILHSVLIDDTYNNDLSGLKNALDYLAVQAPPGRKRILIVSDILQSRENWKGEVIRLAKESGVDEIIGIGPAWGKGTPASDIPVKTWNSTADFLADAGDALVNNAFVLIKGARPFAFEHITARFEEKVHGTVMEVNLENLTHNLNCIRRYLRNDVRLMVMVKAFAYGSGSAEVAALLKFHKVDYLGVAYTDEGIALRNEGIDIPIMVMNPSPDQLDALIRYNLEPEIYSERMLNELLDSIGSRDLGIHIKYDTGMHRLGFESNGEWVTRLSAGAGIKVKSVFTHLASAEDPREDEFTTGQITMFTKLADELAARLGYSPWRHALNSAGIMRFPAYQFDMVRLGIGLHGVGDDPELKPTSSLRTFISQIKTLDKGDTIGYGRRGKATGPMKIATIAIGYADGYSRAFGNGVGTVSVNGLRAPVIGNVCMDMTMIDITGIDAKEGDRVEIFGNDLPISEVAGRISTIPYEILTGVSQRVRRIYVN